jgi:hypothetical protein
MDEPRCVADVGAVGKPRELELQEVEFVGNGVEVSPCLIGLP